MGQQVFSTPGSDTFTVPPAVKSLSIVVIGGGGAGVNAADGAGAGGGAYIEATVTTSPSSTFPVTVGAGGTTGGNGSASNWNSGDYISGGGNAGSGSTGGTGGTTSGTGTTTFTSNGGNGGNGCHTDCTLCNDCECTDPPDCFSYSCFDSSGSSSCDAQGGGGSSGNQNGPSDGSGGSCNCTGTDNCGFSTGSSCTNGLGGGVGASPGGSAGSDAGVNGSAPGGGAGGGNTSGGDGRITVNWSDGEEVYTSQPLNTFVGQTINSFTVESRFADNTIDTSFNSSVTISIANNPGGGALSGTTTVTASSGVATFNDLSIDQIGNGYTLFCRDSNGDLVGATSTAFNMLAIPLTYSVYVRQLAARIGGLIPMRVIR